METIRSAFCVSLLFFYIFLAMGILQGCGGREETTGEEMRGDPEEDATGGRGTPDPDGEFEYDDDGSVEDSEEPSDAGGSETKNPLVRFLDRACPNVKIGIQVFQDGTYLPDKDSCTWILTSEEAPISLTCPIIPDACLWCSHEFRFNPCSGYGINGCEGGFDSAFLCIPFANTRDLEIL